MSDRTIKETIMHLAGTHGQDTVSITQGTVTAVDISTRTCTVTPISDNSETEIENVLLMADVDDGLLYIPAIGSTVIVSYSIRNNPYISMWSELQYITLISRDGIQLQGGELGGLVIGSVTASRLNLIETAISTLIGLYNSHVHAANGTPTGSQDTTIITQTTEAQITNPNIIHGA